MSEPRGLRRPCARALAPLVLVGYRDAKIYDIFEGTGQIQRRIIARSILGVNAT